MTRALIENKTITAKERERLTALYTAILSLKTKEECALFMRDLCTVSELKALGERFEVAKRLAKDQSYRGIADETGASTTTVTRVAHWFHHGMGGYSLAISRIRKGT